MDFNAQDLLWLLLPLAALSGWLIAWRDHRRAPRGPARDLPAAYFRGLNFLLNEQPDKAIEIFVRALEVNSDTVETHLALGNLFRRRGEVERAIRIHQNLIARPSLDREHRSLALLELGQDYLKAGLLDRAENLFLELAEIRPHSEQALRWLVHIYQQEKDWDKAIACSQRLARLSGRNLDDVIAQYRCEQAEQAFSQRDYTGARHHIKQALSADRQCVRASLLLGDLEAAAGRHHEAIKAWQRIEEQDPAYLGEAAERIAEAYRRAGDTQGLYDFFRGALQRHPSVALMLGFADAIEDREGGEAAADFVVQWLRRNPTVHGLHRLIALNLAAADGRARSDLLLLKGIIERLVEQHQGYACEQCGFKGKTLRWLCPSCNRWHTIRPILED